MINKLIILIGFAFLSQTMIYGQKEAANESKIMTVVEKMPEFKGGQSELFVYLGTNIKYPQEAKDKGIEGKVYINFIVNKEGLIKNAKVIKGIDPLLDAEALRLVKHMPDWTPGEQGGQKVSVSYNLPITFKLGIEHLLEMNSNENYQKGVNFVGREYYTKAIKMFTLSINQYPKHIDSYYNRGICYFKKGEKEAACKDWTKAKELGDKGAANLLEKHCQ